MKKLNRYFTIISITILMLSGIAVGQTVPDQDQRIQKDLDIFNNILTKLIINDSPFYFSFDDRVKGVYLDGFGMLFDMESYGLFNLSESVQKAINNIDGIQIINNNNRDTIITTVGINSKKAGKSIDKILPEQELSVSEKVGQTKKLLARFYGDYASAVKSLKPEDRIVVNIRIHSKEGDFLRNKEKEKTPTQLRAAVQVADLISYRQGKLTEEQLVKKIQFSESYDGQNDHEIEIMENILNSALGKSSNKSALAFSGSTRGIYLDNFGVLFFSPASIFDRGMKVFVRNLSQWEQKNRQFEQQSREFERKTREWEKNQDKALAEPPELPEAPEAPELPEMPEAPEMPENFNIDIDWDGHGMLKQTKAEIDSVINDMSNQIIELLGQYAHTIRKVKDNEWIMVAVDFNYKVWDTDESRLYIKVKKSDLLKYNRDDIDLETLKKSVRTWRG